MGKALEGKVALVTGGSRGIGRGIARRLAEDGCSVVALTYRSDRDGATQTARELEAAGSRAVTVQASLDDPAEIGRLFTTLDSELATLTGDSGLDIVVNNAGASPQESLADATPELFDRTIAINARAPFFVAQAAAGRLRRGGRIVNISSVYSTHPAKANPIYSMTKAAVNALSQVLAAELGPRGVTVNTVAPSWTATEANASMRDAASAAVDGFAQGNVLGRMAVPEDIAGVVGLLVSPEASWLTAQYVEVDGRWPTD